MGFRHPDAAPGLPQPQLDRGLATRGAAVSVGAEAIAQAARLAGLVVAAHQLGPKVTGAFSALLLITTFLQLLQDLGLGNGLIQARDLTRVQRESAFWAALAAGVAGFGTAAALGGWVSSLLGAPDIHFAVVLVAAELMWGVLGLVPAAQLARELRIQRLAFARAASSATFGVATVLSVMSGLGLWGLVVGRVSEGLIRHAVCFFSSPFLPRLRFSKHDLQDLVRFGRNATGEQAVNFFGSNIDFAVVGNRLGAGALGIFSLGFTLASLIHRQFAAVLGRLAFMIMSRDQGNVERLWRGFLLGNGVIAVLVAPVLGVVVVSSPRLVDLLGTRWDGLDLVLIALAPMALLRSQSSLAGGLLLSQGRADISFRLNLLAFVLLAIGVLVGVHWGMTGVAVAESLVAVPLFVALTWAAAHVCRQSPRDAFLHLLRLLAILLVTVAVGITVRSWVTDPLAGLAFDSGVIVAIFLTLVALFDRPTLRRLARLARSR